MYMSWHQWSCILLVCMSHIDLHSHAYRCQDWHIECTLYAQNVFISLAYNDNDSYRCSKALLLLWLLYLHKRGGGSVQGAGPFLKRGSVQGVGPFLKFDSRVSLLVQLNTPAEENFEWYHTLKQCLCGSSSSFVHIS